MELFLGARWGSLCSVVEPYVSAVFSVDSSHRRRYLYNWLTNIEQWFGEGGLFLVLKY